MTDKRREQIAVSFRKLLDRGMLRKNAIEQLRAKCNVSRRSIYEYCRKFKVPTN